MPEFHEEERGSELKKEPKPAPDDDKMGNVYEYARTHKIDTISYILLALGLILLFFLPYHGGFLIGLVLGYYFCYEFTSAVRRTKIFVDTKPVAKSIALGVALLALLIKAPLIIIGAAIAAALRHLFERV